MLERAGGKVKGRTGGRADRRTVRRACYVLGTLALALTARPPDRLTAQGTPDSQQVTVPPKDTTHQIGPAGALWRSLLLPGWGQAATGRNVTGALFVAWEGTTMYMTLKAQQEAKYFKESGSPNLSSKRQEVQDWLVLWGFNHLFAGAEAYVAAHLRDFPKDLKFQAVPGGIGLSLPLPHP